MTAINQAWDDSIVFLRRYAGLLIPLALATLLVADVVSSLAPEPRSAVRSLSLGDVLTLFAKVWEIIGQLAITALVLKPGISVAESLSLGSRRLGKVLLVGLLVFVLVLIAFMPVVLWGYNAGINFAVIDNLRTMPTPLAFYILVLAAALVWVTARLLLINALIIDRNPAVRQTFVEAFALTRGIAAQVILVLVIYAVVGGIVGRVIQFAGGAIFALIAGAADAPFLGAVLLALASGLASAALSLFATVFVAMLYRRRINA